MRRSPSRARPRPRRWAREGARANRAGKAGRANGGQAMTIVSARMRAAETAFAAVKDFYLNSRYGERRLEPGICDFTFGNPHEMPLPGIVAALRERALPHDKNWFAYKTSEAQPQEYLAGRLA